MGLTVARPSVTGDIGVAVNTVRRPNVRGGIPREGIEARRLRSAITLANRPIVQFQRIPQFLPRKGDR